MLAWHHVLVRVMYECFTARDSIARSAYASRQVLLGVLREYDLCPIPGVLSIDSYAQNHSDPPSHLFSSWLRPELLGPFLSLAPSHQQVARSVLAPLPERIRIYRLARLHTFCSRVTD